MSTNIEHENVAFPNELLTESFDDRNALHESRLASMKVRDRFL